MSIYHALLDILTKPDTVGPYRTIAQEYLKLGKTAEAQAFNDLIEKKFGKNGDHRTPDNQEQSSNS